MITSDHSLQRKLPKQVDKMTSLVAMVNFFPSPPCCLLPGPMYRVARKAEMLTAIGIFPHQGFWHTRLLSAHPASSRGQY